MRDGLINELRMVTAEVGLFGRKEFIDCFPTGRKDRACRGVGGLAINEDHTDDS